MAQRERERICKGEGLNREGELAKPPPRMQAGVIFFVQFRQLQAHGHVSESHDNLRLDHDHVTAHHFHPEPGDRQPTAKTLNPLPALIPRQSSSLGDHRDPQ